jgi:hypothetical protein
MFTQLFHSNGCTLHISFRDNSPIAVCGHYLGMTVSLAPQFLLWANTPQYNIFYVAFILHNTGIYCFLEKLELHQIFIDFKTVYNSVSREVLYNILIEFGRAMRLVQSVELCLNQTCGEIFVGKHLCNMFSSGLKQGDALSPLYVSLEYAIRKVKKRVLI